tara:strand:+ start:553 stop:3075 length:2523 start_codon:yes stop_codon:yes gene_type:complete
MANTILIKSKTDGAGAPAHGAGLKVAELAVNTSNTTATAAGRGNLFLGVTAESATNLTAGTNTAAAYAADQTGGIVWIGAPILNENNMASDDATKLATQASIKAYVDSQVTAQDLDISADSGSNIAIDLDSEALSIAGGSGITTSITGNEVTIAGDDATTSAKGVASFSSSDFDVSSGAVSIKDNSITLAYMAGGTDGNLITYDASGDPAYVATGNSGQVLTSNGAGAAPTFQAAAGGLDVSGTDNRLVRMHGTDDLQDSGITIDDSDNISGVGTLACGAITTSGNLAVTGTITGDTSLTLDSTTLTTAELGVLDSVTAGTAAASKALVVDSNKDLGTLRNLTIDGTFSDGNYTFDTSGNVSGLGTVGCGAITSSGNLAVTGTITGDTSLTLDSTTLTTAELGVLDSVTAGTAAASKAVVLDASSNIASIGTVGCGAITSTGSSQVANLTVTGDLTVSGDTTTVNTATLTVEDPLIKLASGNSSADAVDIGFYGLCDPSGSQDTFTGLIRDATDGEYHLFDLLQAEPTTTMNTSGTGFDHADLTVGAFTADDASTFTTGLTTAALTATANLDIGSYKFRCAGLMDDTLTSGRVVFTTTNGELTDDSDMSFSGDTLTVTKLGAYEQAGAVDFSDEAMTNVNIDSGAIDGTNVTVGSSKTLDVSAGTLTTSAAQKAAIVNGVGANVDIGAYDFRANTLIADDLTSGRVVFTTTNGQLTDDSDMSFSGDTLTVTKLGAFTATGAIDFDSQNMTNVDIDSGTIDGTNVTVGSSKTLDVSGGTLTTSTAQKKAIVEGVGSSFDVGNVTMTANGITIDGTFTDGTMSIVGGAISSATIDAGSYTAA